MATVYDDAGNTEKVDIGYVGQVESVDTKICRICWTMATYL